MDIQKKLKSNKCRQWSLLPAEFFQTPKGYYIFDTNNVNFLEVSEEIFKIVSILNDSPESIKSIASKLPEYSFKTIKNAMEEIKEIQSEGYLVPQNFLRLNPYKLVEIKKKLSSNLKSLYLNITSKCNLACSYCAYGGDYSNLVHLQNKEMPWEIAKNAIDFFVPRATKEGELRIDFFGGEPLLAFPLIQRVMNTLKEKFQNRNQPLNVFITTNGTVINEKIIDFLIANNVIIQVSIDGEKESHDANRKFRSSNKGSFDIILKNLKTIRDRDIDYFLNNVRVKAVVTSESISRDGEDFFKIKLINELKEQKHFSMINKTPHYNLAKDKDFFDRIHNLGKALLKKKDAVNIEELLIGLNFKQKNLFYLTLYYFFVIQVVNRLRYGKDEEVPYNRDCMIGLEGCVNVDGSISICYQSNSFIIGNVTENTWYFDKIEAFHKKRYAHSAICKNCFVRRFCNLCYEPISGKDGQTNSSIHRFCEFNRKYHRVMFQYMLEIMESNPALWDELQELAEKEKKCLENTYSEVPASEKNNDVKAAELI